MKRKYSYFDGKKQTEREYSYIPFRYILAVFITLLEVLAVIGIAGMFMAIINYPIYKGILGARRKKFADKIIAISDKIMKG